MTPTPDAVQEAPLPPHPMLSRLLRLQFEPVQASWVLLYPEGMVQLNPSAAEILRRCDGQRPFNDIVNISALRTYMKQNDIDIVIHGHKHVEAITYDYT